MADKISRLQPSIDKRRAKKRDGLEKIMSLALKRGSIRNNDVELLLHVSDSTAARYLTELVQSGRLELVGSPHQPTYRPKSA